MDPISNFSEMIILRNFLKFPNEIARNKTSEIVWNVKIKSFEKEAQWF